MVIGVLGVIFGFLLCFSPPFKKRNKDQGEKREHNEGGRGGGEENNEGAPLLGSEKDLSVSDGSELQDDPSTDTNDPLDKKTMKPWLFRTITAIVTAFVCMYTGIECTYGGLIATYVTDVGAASSAGAAYMTSCKHTHTQLYFAFMLVVFQASGAPLPLEGSSGYRSRSSYLLRCT